MRNTYDENEDDEEAVMVPAKPPEGMGLGELIQALRELRAKISLPEQDLEVSAIRRPHGQPWVLFWKDDKEDGTVLSYEAVLTSLETVLAKAACPLTTNVLSVTRGGTGRHQIRLDLHNRRERRGSNEAVEWRAIRGEIAL